MLRDAGLALAIGLAAGVALSYAVSRLAQSLLYEVSPTDPHLVLTSGILAAAAVVATLIPAHRATRIDPSLTLRE
jgi:putative ABC transport system permease protein